MIVKLTGADADNLRALAQEIQQNYAETLRRTVLYTVTMMAELRRTGQIK